MFDYIKDIIASAPPDMRGIVPDSTSSMLFSIHKAYSRLGTAEADDFVSMTARMLFAAKRARPNIQVVVTCLCTRVREPTEDNYLKLTRGIWYIFDTVHLPLIIEWDESGTLIRCIDASFVVNNALRSHTGAMLTFGRGAVFSLSNKQKVNSTFYTVAEISGVDDAMNFVIKVELFIK